MRRLLETLCLLVILLVAPHARAQDVGKKVSFDFKNESLPTALKTLNRLAEGNVTIIFAYDDVELVFDKEALEAVAEKAIERNIGARGLRAVMEGILTSIMYDIPSDPTITKVTITAACVKGEEAPRIDRDPEKASRPARLKGGKNEGEKSRSNPASAS